MRVSALGVCLIIIPDCGHGWSVAHIKAKSGRWEGAHIGLSSRAEAVKVRESMFKHHKKLAKEYAARKRKKQSPDSL